jgi:hypothetical protein
VNPLANLDQKAATSAGVIGGLSSLVSWALGNIRVLTDVVAFLGTACGFLVALISLILKVGEWRRRRRANRERSPRFIQEPPDVDDNIPGV